MPVDRHRLGQLKEALEATPRVSLGTLPTPIEHCPGLTAALNGPDIWVKRDDLTGLALGGNKTRMLEYVLADAIERGADTVVAGAALQSNYCRQLAAACARLGLECHLLLRKVPGQEATIQGGLLLDLLVGAHVQIVDAGEWTDQGARVRDWGRELERRGRSVYVARTGNESGLGRYACGYVQAFVELLEQAEARQLAIDQLWVCSCDATHAGLALALEHTGASIRLVGIPPLLEPITPGWTFPECVASIANECAELLGLETRVDAADLVSIVDYVGPGYGVVTDGGREALRLAARSDGLILDPVYTSKAMAGLIDHVRRGLIDARHRIVFIHTGGLPALFAYADSLGLAEELGADASSPATRAPRGT